MMKSYFLIFILTIGFNCQAQISLPLSDQTSEIKLTIDQANYLYHFAFDCIDREYPNKPGHVLGDSSYLAPPSDLHPAFYGCFDWHSSVHGHWTLITLLTHFPNFKHSDAIIDKLRRNITQENILKEIEYFKDKHNANFERTYGWAWLLKLDEALLEWKHPIANQLHQNLKPLVKLIASKYIHFLDKLIYPIRVGEHPNTAFGMSFALDFAEKYHPELASKISEKAIAYYQNDANAPITWEPGGFDFLSPCLQEASLMQKVLSKNKFEKWLECFIPGFIETPSLFIRPAVVTDRSDGKLAHLDGLNFSRAWCLYEIGHGLNNKSMLLLAKSHFTFSYSKMDSGEYAGAHWLASFASYALIKGSN